MAAATMDNDFPNELDLGEYTKGLFEELLPVVDATVDEWHFAAERARVTASLVEHISAAVASYLVGDLDE